MTLHLIPNDSVSQRIWSLFCTHHRNTNEIAYALNIPEAAVDRIVNQYMNARHRLLTMNDKPRVSA